MEDKYKSMTVPELAGEDSFIRWVTKGENYLPWSQWELQNPEIQDTIAEARSIVKLMFAIPAEHLPEQEQNEIWNKISRSIREQGASPAPKSFSLFRWSIAAAAVLALFVWINSLQDVQKVIAKNGDQKEIILPESSQVIVNAGSKIIYNEEKFTDDRELTLEGEAFFEVHPGSQFTVHTAYGDVTVLGTSFNVIARPGRYEVSCHTGKVSVTNVTEEKVEITAGKKAIGEQTALKVEEFSPASFPSWTQGKFTFDNQPLSVVLDELERQYNVKVVLPADLRDMRYTGLFESDNLPNALHIITWPLHLRYEMKGKSAVVISR